MVTKVVTNDNNISGSDKGDINSNGDDSETVMTANDDNNDK